MNKREIIYNLQLLARKIGKAKERIDTAESELNKIIQRLKKEEV